MPHTQVKPVTFASRVREQSVVMEPQEPVFAGQRVIGQTPGKRIQFENGTYTATTQEEIDFLRSRMTDPGGADLWEIGTPVPDPQDTLVALATADYEEILEILEAEREGHQRPVVIDTAEAILAKIAEHQAEEEPEPPKKAKAA